MTVETVYEAFAATAEKYPDRPFLNVLPGTADIYGRPPGELTYGTARQEVDALARDLMQAGYGAGMRVALLLENRPTFFLHWLAVNRIGGSVVPVNPDLRAAELEYLIGHS
ncbi:MAG: AMP-binding protein, partial [Pseudomonadota bacterium]|nr:AMP-binding protein [Pseudomonadota bacterium]